MTAIRNNDKEAFHMVIKQSINTSWTKIHTYIPVDK